MKSEFPSGFIGQHTNRSYEADGSQPRAGPFLKQPGAGSDRVPLFAAFGRSPRTSGWVQRESKPIEENRPGNVVWFPPDQRHWHGATPTMAMAHIAVEKALNGKVVNWIEKVTDVQHGV
jgi:hypothetical protein